MKILLKNTTLLSASDFSLKCSKAILFLAVANSTGMESLGLYNFIISILAIIVVFGDLGIGTFITKEHSKKGTCQPQILNLAVFKVILTTLLIALFLLFSATGKREFGLFLVVGGIFICDSLISNSYSIWRAEGNFLRETFYKAGASFIYLAVAIILYFKNLGLSMTLSIILFFYFLLSLKASYFYLKKFNLDFSNRFIKGRYIIYLKNSLPIMVAALFTILYFRVDILMLEYFAGYSAVGTYSVASKLIEVAMIVPWALSTALLPLISRSLKSLDLININLLLYFGIGTIIFLIFYFLSDMAIDVLFIEEFQSAKKVTTILSISILIMTMNGYFFTYFVAQNRAIIHMRIAILMAIANILTNLFSIPTFGVVGAGVTTVMTELTGLLIIAYLYFRGSSTIQPRNLNLKNHDA